MFSVKELEAIKEALEYIAMVRALEPESFALYHRVDEELAKQRAIETAIANMGRAITEFGEALQAVFKDIDAEIKARKEGKPSPKLTIAT